MMKIKGDTIKDNKTLLSGRLYKIDACRTIVFEEKGTNDLVNINFKIESYISEEQGEKFVYDLDVACS